MTLPEDRSPHRLQGDIDLVRAVRGAGPDSTASRHLDEALMDVVIGTLTNLNTSNLLRIEVRRQCRIPLPSPPPDWGEHSRRVIFFSARTGVTRFITDYIVGGKWDYRRGASVKTSAVRSGLYSFADEYKTYIKEERGKENLFADPARFPAQVPRTPMTADPAYLVSHQDQLSRLIAGQNDRAAAIFDRVLDGMTHPEIAEDLNTDVNTIDREWRSIKNVIKKRMGKVAADEPAE